MDSESIVIIAQADSTGSDTLEHEQAGVTAHEEQAEDPLSILKEGLLKTEPGLLIWTAASFLILVIVLWKFAWSPILNGLDSRADRIQKELEDAEKASEEAKKVVADERARIDKARKEASEIISRAEKVANEQRQEILDKARQEATEQADSAKRSIQTARNDAIVEIKQIVADLSVEIAGKIMGKSLTAEDHKKIVDESISRYLS